MEFQPPRTLVIDEEGYWQTGELRVQDDEWAQELFSELRYIDPVFWTSHDGQEILVHAFDQPLVVRQIQLSKDQPWELLVPHGHKESFTLNLEKPNLYLDEWDRFHGITDRGLPFVLSRSAQASFFEQVDDYDDTGIFIGDVRIEIPTWLSSNESAEKKIAEESFWSSKYEAYFQEGDKPGWELEGPHPALKEILPQLKLTRSRILVPGCGNGHDAALLAQAGHFVTGVDLSPLAIEKAQSLYGTSERLKWVSGDIFSWAKDRREQFDIVFEHTFFCALSPNRRSDIMKLWRNILVEGGHLLGLFFVTPKRTGPPFGSSEWELRQRFNKNKFRQLYWTRWCQSPLRLGKELVVYAQKV